MLYINKENTIDPELINQQIEEENKMAASELSMIHSLVTKMKAEIYVEIREKIYAMFIDEMKKDDIEWWEPNWPDPIFQKMIDEEYKREFGTLRDF